MNDHQEWLERSYEAHVDDQNISRLRGQTAFRCLATERPAMHVPSPQECHLCDITGADCPEQRCDQPTTAAPSSDF